MWRRVRKITLSLLALLVTLAGIGTIYQWYGAKQDRKTYHPIGNRYDVADKKMHLYTEGTGNVTVVFASGWGTVNPYADFSPLYEDLKPHVKLAVYDRFGYGYSDMTGGKRDIDTITSEIHELLQVSGQKPPYLFAAHSLGSLEAIRYAQRFPDEVKGILLIEGGSPEYYHTSPELTFIPWLHSALRTTGILRTLYHLDGFTGWVAGQSNGDKLLTEELKELNRKAVLLKMGNRNMRDEMRQSRENADTVLAGRKPLHIPITVLTADYFGKLAEDKAWMEGEAALPSWSVAGKQIIVPDSSHYIHSYQPQLVVDELLRLAGF
ncbi:pimeloyl-ACP methyl ester carboxylesterase [Paenibacillus endophyticus]|uniref:Pimeloyl-ACP methyl ester carboxylesterase n=1 Tax=Paenibacillus endophyticus TaxID=1294268 RepID=A0A7W5C9D7_9BACL|nr:alpha/beta hydrolase [Paenibacillus endophyticus]MBB3153412.1 pimeloyl-ACP methyl ester carboxylesterase [Paenibacillus endophyticus]